MKIGQYIHWRYSNYLKHGLSVDEYQGTDPSAIFAQQKTQLLNSLKAPNNKESLRASLEEQINFFFDPTPASIITGYTPEETKRIQEYLISIVKQTVLKFHPKTFSKAMADFSTLRATATGGGSITLADGTTEEWAKIRKAANFNREGQKWTTSVALKRRVLQLFAQRDKMTGKLSKADTNFLEALSALEKDYDILVNEVQNATSNKQMLFSTNRIRSDGTVENIGSFAKAVQNLIDMTKNITNQELQGAIGEIVPAVSQWAWEAFQNKTTDEILNLLDGLNQDFVVDAISGQIKGQQTSTKIALSSKVLGTRKFQTGVQAQIGDTKLNTSATEDKVDIQLNLPNNSKINASVKNVDLGTGFNISILKGANLITYIQDYPVFANHYLNVTANIHRSWDRAPKNIIHQAHEALKMTIALHALTGNLWAQKKDGAVFKTGTAEIFIVNDVSQAKGHFKVYFMSDLMKALANNINYLTIKDFNENKSYYSNKWVGTQQHNMKFAWARVANILAQMRVQKLLVSISPEILNAI